MAVMAPHRPACRLPAWALGAAALVALPSANAWTDHALATRQALSALPAAADAAAVPAETLQAFVEADAARLEKVLAAEEAWAREHVPHYPPRPDALAFKVAQRGDVVARFVAALRLNPNTPLPLFVQVMPGARAAGAPLAWQAVTLLRAETTMPQLHFASVRAGEAMPVLDVVASASDEPDHGFDINVWEDNGTAWGRDYAFGRQPFGNPRAENATQAPFHMGFFHEAGIVYRLAGFLKRTYPEYRIHLYRALAVEAFRSGHPYWGWRFTGWALHHVQDLDGLLRSVADLLVDGGRLCIADLDEDPDGAFHADKVDFHGHNGFDRQRLADQLARAGFADVSFVDATTIFKGDREFVVFLCIATKVGEPTGDH